MSDESLYRRIEVNPDILLGKPVIAGTRIPVYLILNLIASGYDRERILQAYPGLTLEDIQAALWYAEDRMRYEETHSLTTTEALA
jgi:uncharacterized protein (DUF433 family)